MDNTASNHIRPLGRATLYVLTMLSLPFWAAASIAIYTALVLPGLEGAMGKAPIFWEAAVFALGLAIGLVSAGIALGSDRSRHREYGTAGVLLGTSFIALAHMMNWSIEYAGTDANVALPFAVPCFLAFISLILFVNVFRAEDAREPAEPPSEEQQQPLSQP